MPAAGSTSGAAQAVAHTYGMKLTTMTPSAILLADTSGHARTRRGARCRHPTGWWTSPTGVGRGRLSQEMQPAACAAAGDTRDVWRTTKGVAQWHGNSE